MINTVVEAFSGFDILVNNAGIQEECSHELATRDFDNAFIYADFREAGSA